MALNGVIARFKTGTYTVTRLPDGEYVDGEYVLPDNAIELDVTVIDDLIATLTVPAHDLDTGDGPFHLVLAYPNLPELELLPEGLSIDTEYYAIVLDDDTIQLALSEDDAADEIFVEFVGTQIFAISSTRFQRDMCIQPATGRTLDALPEEDRTGEDKLIFIDIPLRTRMLGQEPDSVEIKGEAYTVTASEEWEHWGTTHFRCFAGRDEIT